MRDGATTDYGKRAYGSLIMIEPDDTADTTPRFSAFDAERLARDLYGLTATAAPLPSERDQNFVLETAGAQKFVLKFAKADEQRGILEFQNAALQYVAQNAPELAISRVIPRPSGVLMTSVLDVARRPFWARLVSWIDADTLVHVTPHDKRLLASLGTAMARLDQAFAGFEHASMSRVLHWDLRHIHIAFGHTHLLTDDQQRIIRRFKREWDCIDWTRLRKSVIHGDANDYNVLVREGLVVGLLDFGDIVYSGLVCDLAIALAYAMLGKSNPIEAALIIAQAYHRVLPLQAPEIDSLYTLAVSRLCISVCIAAHNARAKPDDAYQSVTQTSCVGASAYAYGPGLAGCDCPIPSSLRMSAPPIRPTAELLEARQRHFGANVRLSYRNPLHIVRAEGQYLFDAAGRRLLDAYNNVPHVGHCHRRVVQAAY